MLSLSSRSFQNLETQAADRWIDFHVVELARLVPDVRALYSDAQFENLVIRILMRAEAIHLVQENATIAYGYGSLTLGIGFESEETHDWNDQLRKAAPEDQADLIWDAIEARHEEGSGV